MTSQDAAKARGEHLAEHSTDRQLFLLQLLINWRHDDPEFCDVVDDYLAHCDAADAAKAAEVERELAAPKCGVCGGHVGHSVLCPKYAGERTLVDA